MPYLNHRRKALRLSPLSMMLIHFIRKCPYMAKEFFSILSVPRVVFFKSEMGVGFCQLLFLCLLEIITLFFFFKFVNRVNLIG